MKLCSIARELRFMFLVTTPPPYYGDVINRQPHTKKKRFTCLFSDNFIQLLLYKITGLDNFHKFSSKRA